MNIIKKTISSQLKQELNKILLFNSKYFVYSPNTINHKLLYCNKWSTNKYKYMIPLLKKESRVLSDAFKYSTLIQMNIINAPPNCSDQCFHIDYMGNSTSYFIPYIDINNNNGTEYLHFNNTINNLIYRDNLLELSKKFYNNNDLSKIIQYFNKYGLKYSVDYKIKIVNCPAYSLVEMPNYIYHRGQKNKTNKDRFMFNIVFSINDNYKFPTTEVVKDTELDEYEDDIDTVSNILNKRRY